MFNHLPVYDKLKNCNKVFNQKQSHPYRKIENREIDFQDRLPFIFVPLYLPFFAKKFASFLWRKNLCKFGLVSPTPLMNGGLNSLSAFID